MSSRSHREAGRTRAGRRAQRARLAFVALVVAALPLAAAETLAPPAAPSLTTTEAPAGLPTVPSGEPAVLDIDEDLFAFEGTAYDPQRIVVRDLQGASAFEYVEDANGRARVTAGGETLLDDATLLRVDGDPLGDAFSLALRDHEGAVHEVRIDRAALTALADAAPLPGDLPVSAPTLPPVEVSRPLGWPGAPTESYLLFVEDAARNHLAASSLDGAPFVQRSGQQLAVVQVPLADLEWDGVLLRANGAGEPFSENFTFVRVRDTADAAIFHARYALDALGLADGETVELRVVYERRLTPLVAERLPEPVTYQARVDGMAPTVSINAPQRADDLHFSLQWNGQDLHSGLGGFNVQYRVAGTPSWSNWLAPTSEREGTFSGEWGRAYEFRVVALDRVGIPSAQPATATVQIVEQASAAPDADDANEDPTVRILTPKAGDVLAGAARITWEAGDPDGTPVTSRLQVSDDGGTTWRTLFAGGGRSYTWDTTSEADGAGYRLRLTASDGTRADQTLLEGLTIRNVVAPVEAPDAPGEVSAPGSIAPQPTPPSQGTPTGGAPPAATGDATAPAATGAASEAGGDAAAAGADEEKGTPLPGVALVAGALGGAALLARRRRG